MAAVAMAVGASGAAAPAPADRADVQERLDRARERLETARGQERVLTSEVERYGERIGSLEAQLVPLRARSARLDAEVAALRVRLRHLSRRLAEARKELATAKATLEARQALLARRLREIYVRGEPSLVAILLETGSLSSAVDAADVLKRIADHDAALARSVSAYAERTRRVRDAIARTRAEVEVAEDRASDAATEAREAKAKLEDQRADLAAVLDQRASLLAGVRGDRRQLEAETRDLEVRSARLAERIRAAQSTAAAPAGAAAPTGAGAAAGGPPPAPSASASAFAWPVSGTLTSPYGPRWGRMHEGLDIAGGSGTPIRASAAGRVIMAGWSGGYGNLVVVDHGGGISTAYAHNSSISVSVGQDVAKGTVLAGMGTTGNSTGVHSHFEIRVNGSAVDPLGYL